MLKKISVAKVSGIPVSCCTFDDVLENMDVNINQQKSNSYISITNTESMYHALKDPKHFEFINNSDFSLCDGIGSVIAGYAWGHNVPRLNGPVLMLHACEYGINKEWKHFFFGGKEGVADLMSEKLKEKFPDLSVVGTYCPPFRDMTDEELLELKVMIEDAKPDVIWVGLGLLKQEQWIAKNLNVHNVPWMVGVGAAFDYHAGTVSWAPKWIQAIGMEWLYRTILQPRLRIKRYLWSFDFMFSSIYSGIKTRFFGAKSNPQL